MANWSIKDVPEDLAERVRLRAARNHRSLQGELMAIIEHAVRNETEGAAAESLPPPAWLARPGFAGVATGVNGRTAVRRGTKMIEQIATEHRARFPDSIDSGPGALDILRAEGDAE